MPNDHDPLAPLDRRAQRAAQALRAEADRRPVPPFRPGEAMALAEPLALDPRGGRRRRILIGSIAAAAVLVVGVVAWLAATDGDDAGPTTGVSSDLPRPFVLGEVPPALELAGAADVVDAPAPARGLEAPLHLFGPDPTEVELGAALIEGYDAFGDDVSAESGPDRAQAGDRDALVFDDVGFGPLMVMVRVDGGGVALLGTALGRDALLELGAEVEVVDGRPSFPEGTLGEGWSEVGTEPAGMFLSSPVAAARGTVSVGRYAAYLAVGDDGVAAAPMVSVSSLPADVARLHAPALVAPQVGAAQVRGHDAQVAEAPLPAGIEGGGATVIVSWLESDTELVRLHAIGLDRDEVLALAEGVRAVEPDEWADLVEATLLDDLNPVDRGDTEIGRGTFDDGTAWVLRAPDPTGGSTTQVALDVAVADDGEGSSASSSSSEGGAVGTGGTSVVSYELLETGGRRFLSGVAGPGASAVELRSEDGAVSAGPVADDDLRWFVLEVPPGSWDLVVLDGDGGELGRVPVSEDGRVDIDAPATTVVGGPGD